MIDLTDVPVLNKQTIESIIRQANGNEQLINEIFESFVYDIQKMFSQIEQAVKDSDYHQLKMVTHTLKGLSATIGASQLHIVSKEMDNLLKDGKNEQVIAYIPVLTEVYNKCKTLVKEEFKIV